MNSILQDLRYGLRGLRNHPSFAVLAVLALALGIGAATTIFSIIQNVLLDPFPYKDANRVVLVMIHDSTASGKGGRSGFQTPEFLDYQEQSHVFEDVIAGRGENIIYTTRDSVEQFNGGLVSGNTFSFLGVPAALGRTLTPEDAKPGAPPVFVMSYKTWFKRFNLDPNILGQTFMFNGVATTLVGIMPERFTKLDADVYLPVVLDRADPKINQNYFRLQGKLKPGVTLQQAEAELNVLAHQLARVYPKNYPKKFNVEVVSWIDWLVGQFRLTLYTLAAAVGLLLLIACANVANMLLARATAREKEMAIRSALGATRGRIVRQLLIESLLLALAGMIVGCWFAYFGIKALVMAMPSYGIPHEAVIRLNLPVLFFSLGLSGLTVVLFGLVPALQTVRQDLVEPLKDAHKGAGGGFQRGKFRSTLVVIEVALSLVLLAGAGLMIRSFIKLETVNLGFNPNNLLATWFPTPPGQYESAASKQQFFRQLLPRLQALPGVVAVTAGSSLPPYGSIVSDMEIPDKPHAEKWQSMIELCSEGYFQTLGLKLIRGRLLTEVEVNDARKSIVVNQALVNRYFGAEDPIGRRIKFNMLETLTNGKVEDPVFEIVGVVADVKNQGIQDPVIPESFMPYSITGAFNRGIMVKTVGDPLALVKSVQQEIWAINRNVAMADADSLVNFLKKYSYAEPRFSLIVLGIFAGVGLMLVALGVYSVISYTVSRQTHEIGIRMALGATQGNVLHLVMRMGLQLVGIGIVIGVLASLGVTRVLSNQLWNVSPQDPLTLGSVVALVIFIGLIACYFPARRATKVDPMVALRCE